jgi:ribonuclease HII
MSTLRRQRRGHDLRILGEAHGLIGVDEAGRGALAGPVVAGAVLVNRSFLDSEWCRRHAGAINDSKQLTPDERARLYGRMEWLRSEHRILFAAGVASVAEIESENILGATKFAMRRAIESALALGRIHPHPPDPLFAQAGVPPRAPGECISDWILLIDGKPLRGLGFSHRAIVEGDARSLVIAMASIVAKVTRDRLMEALEMERPGYGFARHKGYATGAHRQALVALGSCPHHRSLFIRTFLERPEDPAQARLPFGELPDDSTNDAALQALADELTPPESPES